MMVLTRPLAAIIGALAVCCGIRGGHAEAPRGEAAITCMNLSSGASWQIRIDYDRGTVDSNPASISDSAISWRDAKDGWNYRLDRKNGNLTVILASSTGGNMLFDRCKLEN
jgi:hypothetical protein